MKKTFKWVIIALIIIIAIGLFLVTRYADRVVDPYVRSLLEHTKPMNHRIDYEKIRVNLLSSVINIRQARIYPDSSLIKDENLYMEIKVDNIKLTDFSIIKMLLKKTLVVGDLLIMNPSVIVYLPLHPVQELVENAAESGEEKKKDQLVKDISLDKIMIKNGNFQLFHNNLIIASSKDIDFTASQLSLGKDSETNQIKYSYGEVQLDLSKIIFHSESGLYSMSLESLSVNKHDSSAVLKGFRMTPKYDKKEFSNKLKFQNDRFDVTIARIDIMGVGYRQLRDGQPLEIYKVLLDNVNADIYRDKNVAADSTHFPQFYNESFLKINFPLLLDTVMITNSIVNYGELSKGKENAGEILLENFNLSIFDLSNMVTDSTIVPEMRVFIYAKVMGEGSLNVELVMPLTGPMRNFEFTGSVGAMKLSPLNGMLEPAINMKFNEGRLNRMTFAFKANDNISSGWMEFLYQDLNVEIMRKNPEKQWGFISSMANAVALSHNPIAGKALKIVSVGYERDKNKGLINYVWKTIQSGMVRTIMPTNKYQINKKQAQKYKEEKKAEKKEEKKGEKEKKEKKKKGK